MEENIKKIKESNIFRRFMLHPTPDHPLIKNNPVMKGVWVADILKTDYMKAKVFLAENNIKNSVFNGKKSFFIWP